MATRQNKQFVSLDEHRRRWARRATDMLGFDAATWASAVATSAARQQGMPTAPTLGEAAIEQLAAAALDEVEASKSTWSR